MYAVELKEVNKRFQDNRNKEFVAVDGINLQIAQGEFFSILGQSGCGKTTTLRMIAGFETPTSGEIYIENQPMGKSPPFHRPVNTVFQNYALFPHLTVEQNMAFGLQMEKLPSREISSRVGEVLEIVKLNGFEKRYPRQLSGGQQQRVALGRSLVKQPKVLLLDEPLGALDLKLRKEMQLELKHMQQQLGITFIYVTHDQEEALTMSDRLAVMYQGKVLQLGAPVEIYEKPNSRFVADFIGESNFLTGLVKEQRGDKLIVLVDKHLPVVVTYPHELPVGKLITLAIRPEKIKIDGTNSSEEKQEDNCWLGKLKEAVYIGTDTRYIIALTEQSSLVSRQQNLHCNLDQYSLGEEVKIRVSPDNIRVIIDE